MCLAVCQPWTVHPVVRLPSEIPPSFSEVSVTLHVVEIPRKFLSWLIDFPNISPACLIAAVHQMAINPEREVSLLPTTSTQMDRALPQGLCRAFVPLSCEDELPSPGRSRGGCSCAHFWMHPGCQVPLPTGWLPQPGQAFHAPCGLTPRVWPLLA